MEDQIPAMLTNNEGEQLLLTDCLRPDMRVLEFGLGQSTLVIAARVKQLVTIEHHSGWVDQFKGKLPANVTLAYAPPNAEPKADYDDGTYEDFKDYVHLPRLFLSEGKFDLIFIDGRARVACARFSVAEYLKKDGLIFIHDYKHPKPQYRRPEYEVVEQFLEMVGHEFAMAKFVVRK